MRNKKPIEKNIRENNRNRNEQEGVRQTDGGEKRGRRHGGQTRWSSDVCLSSSSFTLPTVSLIPLSESLSSRLLLASSECFGSLKGLGHLKKKAQHERTNPSH